MRNHKYHISIFLGALLLAYIHILEEKRTKLEPSTLKGIFVGYNQTSKANKVYIMS